MQLGHMLPNSGSAKTVPFGVAGHVRPQLRREATCPDLAQLAGPPARILAWQVVRVDDCAARMTKSQSFAQRPRSHIFVRAKNGDAKQSAGNEHIIRMNAEQGARCCPNQS